MADLESENLLELCIDEQFYCLDADNNVGTFTSSGSDVIISRGIVRLWEA